MKRINTKSKFYPYLISIFVAIYITTQFLAIGSASSVGLMLKEVAQKQETIFNFLISQSIEGALRTASSENIVQSLTNYKESALRTVSFNKNIKIYDISVFDLDGNLIAENIEGINSFSSLFGSTKPSSVIEPMVANIRYSKIYEDTVMDILIPIFEDGKLIGIMWQTESFERINSAMKNVSILNSGESYIIDRNGQVLTDLKKANIVDGSITIKERSILDDSIDGFEKIPYLDYKDEYVYGYHAHLNLNKWKLVVEVSEDEVTSTTGSINSFLLRSMALILATSKVLEPMINNIRNKRQSERNKKEYDYENDANNISRYECISEKIIKEIKIHLYHIVKRYKENANLINITSLVIFISISIIVITNIKTNNDIQNNLNSSSQVNRRLISYFINEVKGQFYLNTRLVNEFDTVDMEESFSKAVRLNNNFLNIIVLDNNYKEIFNVTNAKINKEHAIQALNQNSNFYNSIGISEIFFDENYNQYVFYLSARTINNKSDKWKNTICVVSFENLSNMLVNNEIYSSRIITLLNEDEIMYSNLYEVDKLDQETYEYLKTILNQNDGTIDSIFDVNKYTNIKKDEVYAAYSNLNNSEVVVYGSYVNINDTNWQLLYEESVDIAKKRVKEVFINLLVDVFYEYIQNTIKSI